MTSATSDPRHTDTADDLSIVYDPSRVADAGDEVSGAAEAADAPRDPGVPTLLGPTAADPPPSTTWVAAYAMGLVASRQQTGGVEQLLAYVEDAAPLRAAARHLEDAAVGDRRLRADARALLEAALARVR